MAHATGKVIKAFGNLLHVQFDGDVRQGEVGDVVVDNLHLRGEVIEIAGNVAKMQVFEDTRGIKYGTKVEFNYHLLEAELAPGLIGSIFDGLQNPLESVAKEAGLFLQRGVYHKPLDRSKKWEFHPIAQKGAEVKRGDVLGTTQEGRFTHKIMVPFSLHGTFKVVNIVSQGAYTIEEPVATLEDATGKQHTVAMLQKWSVKAPLLAGKKVKAHKMMDTGLRTLDTQYPVIKGGTFCSPGPFGAGKTVLQHHLSKYSSVDIVVIAACGERAGEVVEVLQTFPHLTDPHTGESLLSRTIIICNTSSMPVAAREASVYMGVTLGEYYRQMGLNVLLLADSTSRWAQAMREMSGRLEEIPGEEAFPAYLASRVAAFYERSGEIKLGDGSHGSLTIGGTVSPAGGNFEEPMTQATLSVVGAFHGLSRARSDARKYPAIDPMISWSKYVDDVGKELGSKLEGWGEKTKAAKELLMQGDEIGKRMEVVGEEGVTIEDLITYLKAELYDFSYLQQNAFDKEDAYCPLERQIELFSLIQEIFDANLKFSSHDEARSFFMSLQNQVKNMNFMSYGSERYKNEYKAIQNKLKQLAEV